MKLTEDQQREAMARSMADVRKSLGIRERPPFAVSEGAWCECGWPLPGEIAIDATMLEFRRFVLQCPMCGMMHGTTETEDPKQTRPMRHLRLVTPK
jgi:hypothetical protein